MIGFDRAVPPSGYAWWYVDALSDDGRHGITLIAFIGSVFSPYYAAARRRGPADPRHHVALNVALYGERRAWTMTERGRARLLVGPAQMAIGPSVLEWRNGALRIDIDEVTAPVPARLRGTVRVLPAALTDHVYRLDGAGRHRWRPLAPTAQVEVSLQQPALRWHGTGYLDGNDGDASLEDDFRCWTWSRTSRADGPTTVLYDVARRDGAATSLALRFDAGGRAEAIAAPPTAILPPSGWRIARTTRSDGRAEVIRTLEDAPFYARSLLQTTLGGEPVAAMHESLDLDRFRRRWVQALLPFRMPRRAR
jgi:carotenoid 1,2-hydratase